MNVKEAYNLWSEQYDTNHNRTRDLEALSLRESLEGRKFGHCLEIGCGTGKNTEWLVSMAENVLAVDLSEEMLSKAIEKNRAKNVRFLQADITQEWHFVAKEKYDLATFSLVLEHIENLDEVFRKLGEVLKPSGTVYISELHPFKQYSGSKARFETSEGLQIVTCFTHHVSDFVNSAKKYHLQLADIREYFDDNDKTSVPRILTLIFKKE